MDKKSTFFAAVLLAAGSLTVTANAETVDSKNWTEGKYYYLKVSDKYLSLCGTKADSVVVKTFDNATKTKASCDSALWEITNVGTETAGAVYQFKNKKTQALLSFAKSKNAKPILSEGISKWTFKDNVISAYVSDKEEMKLSYSDTKGIVFNEATGSTLTVTKPGDAMVLTPKDLGGGFSVFRLTFGGKYEGNIFEDKDLIATTDEDGYLKLQVAGDESYADGKKKYIGVDTLKTTISGAKGAFGYKFSLDSIRQETGKENKAYKQFKFTADLMNDSLTIYVKDAPKATSENTLGKVRVVYAQFDNTLVLTVADVETTTQGVAPLITFTKGTPAKIADGTGVYFIKSASKGATAGKYISAFNNGIVTMSETPSVNHPMGQWYIKEEGGMYSIVDRLTNTALLLKGEVFAVQGMENTFTLGGNADSITVEPQKVDLEDNFLGSKHFTTEDMANHGYALNLIPTGSETSDSYAVIADSILQIKSVEAENAFVFKIETSGEATAVGGAKALGDTIYMEKYKLKSQFSDKYVAYDQEKKSLKLSTTGSPFVFCFNTSNEGGKYNIELAESTGSDYRYISADMSSSNMILSNTPAYFKFVEMDAPEYGTFETGHMRFTSDAKSLTMNTLTTFAEMKVEGQEILKSTYESDNFSLKLIASDASTPERPLYYITTVMPGEVTKAEAVQTRYYMVSGKDSATTANKFMYEDKYRVHFIPSNTPVTKEDDTTNPALWALKIQESGDYLLENQQAANDQTASVKCPYVGIVNNVVVMSATGIEFALEKTSAPVANEAITASETVKVIGGHGELQILNAGGKKITISNILGQTIATRFLASDNEVVASARGIVIVSIDGDKAYKAIVK